jgi:hypothetical protein
MRDCDGKVALLVDFENLVFGLEEVHGDEFAGYVEPELLFRLAEEYGQVVVANAYADWRSRSVNQFQTDLYRLGLDLVHVFAKRQQSRVKNAVDVKMAVDAVEAIWTLPHVTTFVIVSGDRDFIHVLKTLRRHGKTVVGVSPDQSVSEDFASLCDRFVRYGALFASYGPAGAPKMPPLSAPQPEPLDSVRTALRDVLAEHPNGLKGAQVKPLLRRRLSATFDESEYGFSRVTGLLLALPDVVTVVPDRRGGDIMVLPAGLRAGSEPSNSPQAALPAASEHEAESDRTLARAAGLPNYAFDPNAEKRRRILAALFVAMKAHEPFTLADVFERTLQDNESLSLSISRLAKYQMLLWHSRSFLIEANQQDKPLRERLMRLHPAIATEQDMISRYAASVAYKLAAAARSNSEALTAQTLCRILGLTGTSADADYCAMLIMQSG